MTNAATSTGGLRREYGVTGFGESMLCLSLSPDQRCTVFGVGAEANLVSSAALVGVRARWVSRLGKDQAGDIIEAELVARGVDVVAARDASRQTALCIKDSRDGVVTMRYYRSDSAATAFDGVESLALDNTAWLHLTGIDLALSEQTRAATIALARAAVQVGTRVSFDVNYRPALWTSPEECWNACQEIFPLADLIFIGDVEAEILLPDVPRAQARKSMLRGPGQILIYKRGSLGAEFVTDRESGFVPALDVPVTETTGAGDALAAGVVVGLLRDQSIEQSLVLGVKFAALAIQTHRDVSSASELRAHADVHDLLGWSAAVCQNHQARFSPAEAGARIEQWRGVGRQA